MKSNMSQLFVDWLSFKLALSDCAYRYAAAVAVMFNQRRKYRHTFTNGRATHPHDMYKWSTILFSYFLNFILQTARISDIVWQAEASRLCYVYDAMFCYPMLIIIICICNTTKAICRHVAFSLVCFQFNSNLRPNHCVIVLEIYGHSEYFQYNNLENIFFCYIGWYMVLTVLVSVR